MRSVDVTAASARDEAVAVVRAAVAVAAIVWIYIALAPLPATGSRPRGLLPFQAIVQTLPPDEQRMFRELQVSLLEAETIRSAEGAWPDAERLAAEGIEPFAPNPALKGPDYEWTMVRAGLFVTYLGRPAGAGAPAWLVMAQEPDPAAPPEVFVDDEEHDRLLDGSVLHVSIWKHAEGERVPPRVGPLPQAEGWTQLYAVDPSAAASRLE